MANWALSSYVIEGPAKTLKKIYKALKHPVVQEKVRKIGRAMSC